MINYTLFHIHSLIFSTLQAIFGEDRRHSFTIKAIYLIRLSHDVKNYSDRGQRYLPKRS
jgi:hypothetical protein